MKLQILAACAALVTLSAGSAFAADVSFENQLHMRVVRSPP